MGLHRGLHGFGGDLHEYGPREPEPLNCCTTSGLTIVRTARRPPARYAASVTGGCLFQPTRQDWEEAKRKESVRRKQAAAGLNTVRPR
jgi:hypothetical protein